MAARPFISTRELAQVLDNYFPANEQMIREWCEGGDIPPKIAKRNPAKKRAQWFIKVAGLPSFLQDLLQLEPEEIEAVMDGLKKH